MKMEGKTSDDAHKAAIKNTVKVGAHILEKIKNRRKTC